jgi:hypothetical protein
VGDISILRNDRLVARSMGFLDMPLSPGRYQVRIDHAEASATYDIEVGDEPLRTEFELPRRSSATLLSSTIDKRERLTFPAVAASQWDSSKGGQAAFVSLRPREADGAEDGEQRRPWPLGGIAGSLFFFDGPRPGHIHAPNSLHRLEPGTSELYYDDPDGGTSILPIPIAKDWDTHIFILTDEGRPQLATASISMRPAGVGFDPSDRLIDAYEQGIADLVTGGPGPSSETLDNLLWGKYRNPLFGLLGAHFLIRKLRREAEPNPAELNRLTEVTQNLGNLLGTDAPDIVALRLWKSLIGKETPTERFPRMPPLFNVGFQAFIEATAWLDRTPERGFNSIALGLDGNSPWTLWKPDRTFDWTASRGPRTSTFDVASPSSSKLRAIEKLSHEAGFLVEWGRKGELYSLRATRESNDNFAAAEAAWAILSVPESVVSYMRDAIDQSRRTKEPLDFGRLVRRTMLPREVLLAAKVLAELTYPREVR